jgi:hypothetical protein
VACDASAKCASQLGEIAGRDSGQFFVACISNSGGRRALCDMAEGV